MNKRPNLHPYEERSVSASAPTVRLHATLQTTTSIHRHFLSRPKAMYTMGIHTWEYNRWHTCVKYAMSLYKNNH